MQLGLGLFSFISLFGLAISLFVTTAGFVEDRLICDLHLISFNLNQRTDPPGARGCCPAASDEIEQSHLPQGGDEKAQPITQGQDPQGMLHEQPSSVSSRSSASC